MLCHISPSRCQCPSVPAMQTEGKQANKSFPFGVFLDVTEPERMDFSLFLPGRISIRLELVAGGDIYIYISLVRDIPLSLKISKRLKLTVVSNYSDLF